MSGPPVARGEGLPLRDRLEAGDRLAAQLGLHPRPGAVVLALPRGGVPIARRIAESWGAPLDVLVVRKVGAPGSPEYALGAVAEGAEPFLDEGRIRRFGLAPRDLAATVDRERQEVERLARRYRAGRARIDLSRRPVVLVDDGLATGATMRVAVDSARRAGAHPIVVAVGVAPEDAVRSLERHVDEVVVALVPARFFAVGEWYLEFPPVSDVEVARTLARFARPLEEGPRPSGPTPRPATEAG